MNPQLRRLLPLWVVGHVSKVGAKIVIFFGFAIICLHWSGYILIRSSGAVYGYGWCGNA